MTPDVWLTVTVTAGSATSGSHADIPRRSMMCCALSTEYPFKLNSERTCGWSVDMPSRPVKMNRTGANHGDAHTSRRPRPMKKPSAALSSV